MSYDHKMGVYADRYYLEKGKMDMMDKMGMKCEPLDMNAAMVEEKPGTGLEKRDLEEVQDNIRERFNMCDKADYAEEGGEY